MSRRYESDDAGLNEEAEQLRRQANGNGAYANGNGRDSSGDPQKPWLHEIESLDFIDFASAPDNPPDTREWLVQGWFPMLETTGLGGPGGEGKTLLAQMLATSAAIGRPWLGKEVRRMKAALVFCEDRQDDVLWRQADINRAYSNLRMADLAGRIRAFPRRDKQFNYLAVFDRDGNLNETIFFAQLLDDLKRFAANEPLLTVLDTRSDVFWGNQNDERHARMFVRKISDRVARETGGLVILIFQPSLAQMASGSGSSGSVQWTASMRAHAYLESADEEDSFKRTIRLIKANYADKNQSFDIRWTQGCFITQEEADVDVPDYERNAQAASFQRIFLAEFTKYRNRTERPLTTARAPKELAVEARRQKGNPRIIREQDMSDAMRTLIERGQLRREMIGPPSRQQEIILPPESPQPEPQ